MWRCQGDCIALLTYLGLHTDSGNEPYEPTASTEARRRLVSQIFNIDKVSASFSGRPPLLSRRYLLTPLPLDLDDEDLMGDKERLSRAIANLDSDGWGQDGKLYSTTILRARFVLCRNKDEIMELALGHRSLITVDKLLSVLPAVIFHPSQDAKIMIVSSKPTRMRPNRPYRRSLSLISSMSGTRMSSQAYSTLRSLPAWNICRTSSSSRDCWHNKVTTATQTSLASATRWSPSLLYSGPIWTDSQACMAITNGL